VHFGAADEEASHHEGDLCAAVAIGEAIVAVAEGTHLTEGLTSLARSWPSPPTPPPTQSCRLRGGICMIAGPEGGHIFRRGVVVALLWVSQTA
jgi:hypothetical protein